MTIFKKILTGLGVFVTVAFMGLAVYAYFDISDNISSVVTRLEMLEELALTDNTEETLPETGQGDGKWITCSGGSVTGRCLDIGTGDLMYCSASKTVDPGARYSYILVYTYKMRNIKYSSNSCTFTPQLVKVNQISKPK